MTTVKIYRTVCKIPNLGKKLRIAKFNAKRDKGLTLIEICEAVGMSKQNWYLIEGGKTKVISEEMLIKLEKVLDVDLRKGIKELSAA